MTTTKYILPAVLFMVFASPATFKAVRGILGGWVAGAEGQAKLGGLLLHALLFVWVVGYLMRRVSKYGAPLDGDDEPQDGPYTRSAKCSNIDIN
jgi:hypothetical protein